MPVRNATHEGWLENETSVLGGDAEVLKFALRWDANQTLTKKKEMKEKIGHVRVWGLDATALIASPP